MSDTPETDKAKFTTYSTRHGKYIEAVMVDFAREQEREIQRLRSQLNKAEVERAWALDAIKPRREAR